MVPDDARNVSHFDAKRSRLKNRSHIKGGAIFCSPPLVNVSFIVKWVILPAIIDTFEDSEAIITVKVWWPQTTHDRRNEMLQ